MQTATTFLDAGWDFVGETVNGPNDVWKIVEDQTYPLLSWQKYGGGIGDPNDPYLIYTAEHLNVLGAEPNDYDKHFKLMADIDLLGYVYDRAVIAADVNDTQDWFQGTPFTGGFDGNGHTVSHLSIRGVSYLGLFGKLGAGAHIHDLGVHKVDVSGAVRSVGGLVGKNSKGNITSSYSSGTVTSKWAVGMLVGRNWGDISNCCTHGIVSGSENVGGLVGSNYGGNITASYSTATVKGEKAVGGLAGENSVGGIVSANHSRGRINTSYSTGTVIGVNSVGGLVGNNSADSRINASYSTCTVTGHASVGGLVGRNSRGRINASYGAGRVNGKERVGGLVGGGNNRPDGAKRSVWDMETSGQSWSYGGIGLSTAEMMTPHMLGLNGFADDPNWILDAGRDYPRLAWEGSTGQVIPEPEVGWLEGQGTEAQPYCVDTADQLIFLGRASLLCDRHFVLRRDIDLKPSLPGRRIFTQAVIPTFAGAWDGNGHVIYNLVVEGASNLGLFGQLGYAATVSNLGVVDGNISGSGSYVGSLAGLNYGDITQSYSSGTVSGVYGVGGLVGSNHYGSITVSYSTGVATGGAP